MHLTSITLHKKAKKAGHAKLFLPLLLLLVVFSDSLYSQEKIGRPALRDIPSLSIVVHQIQRSITESFDIDVILENLTNKSIDVKQVRVFLPESIKSIRNDKINEILTDEIHQIKEGTERIYRLGIKRAQLSLIKSLLNLETLLFSPGTYVIRSEAIFKESGSDSYQRIYATHELSLEPPLSALLRGGILGSLLLALFVPAYRYMQHLKRSKMKFKEVLLQSLTFFITGSIVSITAILLLQRLGSLNLPITIVVNDWLGGVVVGCFSYTIGDVLYKKFFGLENESTNNA